MSESALALSLARKQIMNESLTTTEQLQCHIEELANHIDCCKAENIASTALNLLADEQNAYEALLKLQIDVHETYKNVFMYSREQISDMLLLMSARISEAL